MKVKVVGVNQRVKAASPRLRETTMTAKKLVRKITAQYLLQSNTIKCLLR